MTYSGQNHPPMDDLLAALTDALLAGDGDLDRLARDYAVPDDVRPLLHIIGRLQRTLVGVQPSRRFVTRLRGDLVGQPGYGFITRVRYLPPRVQIAAGVALLAGFMIFARWRFTGGAVDDMAPETVSAR